MIPHGIQLTQPWPNEKGEGVFFMSVLGNILNRFTPSKSNTECRRQNVDSKPAYAEGMDDWDSSHWVSSEKSERQCAFTHYLEGNASWRPDFAEFLPPLNDGWERRQRADGHYDVVRVG